MLRTDANSGGLLEGVIDDLQAQLAADLSVFIEISGAGPFYNYNKLGVEPSDAIFENWRGQG